MTFQRNIPLATIIITATLDVLYVMFLSAFTGEPSPGNDVFHAVLVLTVLTASLLYLHGGIPESDELQPVHSIGRIVIAISLFLLLIGAMQLLEAPAFQQHGNMLEPLSYPSFLASIFLAIAGSTVAILILVWISRLIFIKRRRNTRRNYVILLVFLFTYLATEFMSSFTGLGVFGVFAGIAYALSIVAMLFNSFRFSWILSLSRREKLINLLLTLVGFVFFIILTVYSNDRDGVLYAVHFYHPVLSAFVSATFLFGIFYMGIGFTSTLLHLPTAKEFDRKKLEISSLQNLSRLITDVFDFDELVSTTTRLALEVSEGDAAWLELSQRKNPRVREDDMDIAVGTPSHHSMRNITSEEVERLLLANGTPLRELVMQSGSTVLVQDFARDRRLHASTRGIENIGSIALVPLTSHGEIIGLLCVVKRNSYDFDKDILNMLYALADIISIAIENNRLIRESIVKERMEQELLVAQQMQRSLLPRMLPSSPRFEIAAKSVPAYEVGGDYYDVLRIDEHRLGIVVGDVSGKGVSAALYMAQLKGIFQSLAGESNSTREILVRMNAPLCTSMDRRSFISMLYAMLDTRDGTLSFSRAGHCPLLYAHDGAITFMQPNGMALGLDASERFVESLHEESIQLAPGDVVVMYSDGVTEARNEHDEEFQYSRLSLTVQRHLEESAHAILDAVLDEVHAYSKQNRRDDDMTVLVLRWKAGI